MNEDEHTTSTDDTDTGPTVDLDVTPWVDDLADLDDDDAHWTPSPELDAAVTELLIEGAAERARRVRGGNFRRAPPWVRRWRRSTRRS